LAEVVRIKPERDAPIVCILTGGELLGDDS